VPASTGGGSPRQQCAQVVISGTTGGCAASDAAVPALLAAPSLWAVSGAFHSPMIAKRGRPCAFRGGTGRGCPFATASIPVLSNTDPAPRPMASCSRRGWLGQGGCVAFAGPPPPKQWPSSKAEGSGHRGGDRARNVLSGLVKNGSLDGRGSAAADPPLARLRDLGLLDATLPLVIQDPGLPRPALAEQPRAQRHLPADQLPGCFRSTRACSSAPIPAAQTARLPLQGPVVVVANHRSHLDPALLGPIALGRPVPSWPGRTVQGAAFSRPRSSGPVGNLPGVTGCPSDREAIRVAMAPAWRRAGATGVFLGWHPAQG